MDSNEYLCPSQEVKTKAKQLRGVLEHMLEVNTTLSKAEIKKHYILNDHKIFSWHFTSPLYAEFPATKAFSRLHRHDLADLEWALVYGFVHVLSTSSTHSPAVTTQAELVSNIKTAMLEHIKSAGADETNFARIIDTSSPMYEMWEWEISAEQDNFPKGPYKHMVSCLNNEELKAIARALDKGEMRLIRRADPEINEGPIPKSVHFSPDTIEVEPRDPKSFSKKPASRTRKPRTTASKKSILKKTTRKADEHLDVDVQNAYARGKAEGLNSKLSILEDLQRDILAHENTLKAREEEVMGLAQRNQILEQKMKLLEEGIIGLKQDLPATERQNNTSYPSNGSPTRKAAPSGGIEDKVAKSNPLLASLMEEKIFLENELRNACQGATKLSAEFEQYKQYKERQLEIVSEQNRKREEGLEKKRAAQLEQLKTQEYKSSEEFINAEELSAKRIRDLEEQVAYYRQFEQHAHDPDGSFKALRDEVHALKEELATQKAEASAREHYLKLDLSNIVRGKEELNEKHVKKYKALHVKYNNLVKKYNDLKGDGKGPKDSDDKVLRDDRIPRDDRRLRSPRVSPGIALRVSPSVRGSGGVAHQARGQNIDTESLDMRKLASKKRGRSEEEDQHDGKRQKTMPAKHQRPPSSDGPATKSPYGGGSA